MGFRFSGIVICCAILLSIPAGACMCGGKVRAPGTTIREIRVFYISRLDDTDPVFLGTVERQEVRSDPTVAPDGMFRNFRLVTLRAIEVYRGPKQEVYEVRTGLWGGDCGFDFETGDEYLVYAERDKKGALYTTHCSDTALAEFAGPDLRILRGQPPAPDDLLDQASYGKKLRADHMSSICGRVTRSDGTAVSGIILGLSRERHDCFPLKGYPAEVGWAEPKSDGSFCVSYVRRGTYILSATDNDPSTDTQFVGSLSAIHVEAGKNVNGLNLVLHRDLLYSARKHVIFLTLIVVGAALAVGTLWVFRRKRTVAAATHS